MAEPRKPSRLLPRATQDGIACCTRRLRCSSSETDNSRVDPKAKIAPSARIVGNVSIGAHCYVDHGVVIASSGPPIELDEGAIVFAGSVIRSVGGRSRPAFPVHIGARTLVSPLCSLVGCRIGQHCYIATGVIVLQGAILGDLARIGAGAIVHASTTLPDNVRVGMRNIAAPTEHGFISTADVALARESVAAADFFETAFGTSEHDQARLHEDIASKLLEEVHGWDDEILA